MPSTFYGAPTAGAQQMTSLAFPAANRIQEQGYDLRTATAQKLKADRDRLVGHVDRLKAEREAKRAERKAEGGDGGMIGAGVGAALGIVLAPFTFGTSLALTATSVAANAALTAGALSGIGGSIGTAVDGPPAQRGAAIQGISQGFTGLGGRLMDAGTRNPFYTGYSPYAGGGGGSGGSSGGGSGGGRGGQTTAFSTGLR